MKKCKYCQQEIDAKAKICPHCKKKQSNPIIRAVCIFFGVILICGGISTAFGGTETDTNTNTNSTNSNNESVMKETDECYMTIEKFNQINTGMSYDEVKNIVGCDGKLSTESSVGDQTMKVYYWYAEDGISNATFSFYNDVLSAKSQIGLE